MIWPLNDDLAAMIPQQLDLFGGAPKPPKKIRVEEEPATTAPVKQELESFQPSVAPEPAVAETVVRNEELLAENVDAVSNDSTSEPVEEKLLAVHETPDHFDSSATGQENHEPVAEEIENVFAESNTAEAPIQDSEEAEQEATVIEEQQPAADLEVPSQLNIPPDEILFKRQYYSMGETAAMFDITHSMLRYWENEFDILQPRKNKKGDRYFRPADIKNLQIIYHLIKVRKFTLDGAREYLRNNNKAIDTFGLVQRLEKVQAFLNELKAHL